MSSVIGCHLKRATVTTYLCRQASRTIILKNYKMELDVKALEKREE